MGEEVGFVLRCEKYFNDHFTMHINIILVGLFVHILRSNGFVAICLCTRYSSLNSDVQSQPLLKQLFPSIVKTTLQSDNVRVFVAIDSDDYFWLGNKKYITQSEKSLNITLLVVSKEKLRGRIPFNEITAFAFLEGAEFIVRINDDTVFTSSGWIALGIKALAGMYPLNVGVVAPRLHYEINERIFIHDMVHRTHLLIFSTYYPRHFKNWFIDDWITLVYGPKNAKHVNNWYVSHLNVPTRYEIKMVTSADLASAVDIGKKKIKRFISFNNATTEWA